MRFIDLFAGLGGFHVALESLGHECVFAAELDPELRECYERNFHLRPVGDIRETRPRAIPDHDILCAGFPCQPFSKAGEQEGFLCPVNGDLFEVVVKILRAKRPRFFILENVPNLARHDSGRTLAAILRDLGRLGYSVDWESLSPHEFGVPQNRQRVFIVGSLSGLNGFSWPQPKATSTSIRSVLDRRPRDARPVPDKVLEALRVWQDFLTRIPRTSAIPSFPIWAMEFGATYPYEETTPFAVGSEALHSYKGSFGRAMTSIAEESRLDSLPSHAQSRIRRFPAWKQAFIRQNREFYREHKRILSPWLSSVSAFPSSFQKLEWNCKGEDRVIWDYVIQLRASGIRVKRVNTAPSLVAMTTTQLPIIGWEKRFMTVRECARLQSLDMLGHLPSTSGRAYKALGNAVNATVAAAVSEALLSCPVSIHSARHQTHRSTRTARI